MSSCTALWWYLALCDCRSFCVCVHACDVFQVLHFSSSSSSLYTPLFSHNSSSHQSLPFICQLLFLSFLRANAIKPFITSCGTKLIEDDWFFPGCSDPALANRQRELEEELAQARGLRPQRGKKMGSSSPHNLQVRAVLY